MNNNYRIIESLLWISFLATLSISIYPELIHVYWLNNFYFLKWDYFQLILQFFTSQFIHWDFMHLIFNSIFILLFWKIIENTIWSKNLTIFFITASIFIWISLLYLSNGTTIWMSGFAMALLSFYTLKLYDLKDSEYKWGIFALFLNIAIGFAPWISLVWHLFWWIYWIIFYFYMKYSTKF